MLLLNRKFSDYNFFRMISDENHTKEALNLSLSLYIDLR